MSMLMLQMDTVFGTIKPKAPQLRPKGRLHSHSQLHPEAMLPPGLRLLLSIALAAGRSAEQNRTASFSCSRPGRPRCRQCSDDDTQRQHDKGNSDAKHWSWIALSIESVWSEDLIPSPRPHSAIRSLEGAVSGVLVPGSSAAGLQKEGIIFGGLYVPAPTEASGPSLTM